MLEDTVTRSAHSVRQPQDLLREAFSRHGLEAPELNAVAAAELPEPYRTLLVHDADMTSTLKRYHGGSLVLKRLHLEQGADALDREVVLCKESSAKPVEYGVIRIMLAPFEPQAREAIVAGEKPLGQILDDFSVAYVSRPSEFFCIPSVPYLDELLADAGVANRYGRVNTLTKPNGELLAKVLEILPGV